MYSSNSRPCITCTKSSTRPLSLCSGKSLTTISVLHTALLHPAMSDGSNGQLIRTVLLVVPKNVVANWEAEFDKWIVGTGESLVVHSINSLEQSSRAACVARWNARGGILLLTQSILVSLGKEERCADFLQPDILVRLMIPLASMCRTACPRSYIRLWYPSQVIDEAHVMLKKTDTKIFKSLLRIKTPRRILLTGSPFQNNLLEYFRMVNYVRPDVFGVRGESEFNREFVEPIMKGTAADAPVEFVQAHILKTKELFAKLEPYVHRKDSNELRKELPRMQQVVLHVRPSRIQTRLYTLYKKLQTPPDSKYRNFFQTYSDLRTVHNHPACLLMNDAQNKKQNNEDWWSPCIKNDEEKKSLIEDVESGGKVVILLHILAYAKKIGEKVLVFSQCLKTLNFIEKVIGMPDWKKSVPSLAEAFPELTLFGMVKNTDYMRIDGGTSVGTRGELITRFNENGSQIRLFLISKESGG